MCGERHAVVLVIVRHRDDSEDGKKCTVGFLKFMFSVRAQHDATMALEVGDGSAGLQGRPGDTVNRTT